MFLTSTVYQHPFLVHTGKRDVHPVFIGPALLHKDASSEAYAKFFLKIKSQIDKGLAATTISPLIIGSDQEGAITKARKQVFPNARSIFCTLHIKKDMKRQMEQKNLSKETKKAVNAAFFGSNGLLASKTTKEFLVKKEILLEKLDESQNFK